MLPDPEVRGPKAVEFRAPLLLRGRQGKYDIG